MLLTVRGGVGRDELASMRPRGRTPRMPNNFSTFETSHYSSFNEAAGAYPADAEMQTRKVDGATVASMRPRGRTPRMPPVFRVVTRAGRIRFNEAAGAYPADARNRMRCFMKRAPLQ